MVDFKLNKPVSTSFAAIAATVGSFPVPVAPGAQTSVTATTRGMLFSVLTDETGSAILTINADNAPVVGTAAGILFEGIFVSPLPTYASGDAAVVHTDSRGRLLVSLSNPSSGTSIDIDTDDSPAPANPTGIWTLSIFRSTLPTYTDGDAAVTHVSQSGELLVLERKPGTSSVTSVAASASNVTLLASNASRRAATVFNDSASANLYLKLGATASTTSFTTIIGPNGYYEVPTPAYTGIIDGIWDAAVGNARITEVTI